MHPAAENKAPLRAEAAHPHPSNRLAQELRDDASESEWFAG